MRKKRAHGLGKAGLSWEHICLPAVVRDSIQGRELTLESIRMMAPVENRSSGLVVQEMRIALAEQEARMASLGLTVPTIENELIDYNEEDYEDGRCSEQNAIVDELGLKNMYYNDLCDDLRILYPDIWTAIHTDDIDFL